MQSEGLICCDVAAAFVSLLAMLIVERAAVYVCELSESGVSDVFFHTTSAHQILYVFTFTSCSCSWCNICQFLYSVL